MVFKIKYEAGYQHTNEYGVLTLIKRLLEKNKALWQCHCGKEFNHSIVTIISGNTKSCGCWKFTKNSIPSSFSDRKYFPGYEHKNDNGIITYLDRISHDKYHMAKWKCHCGNEWVTSVNAVTSNSTKSCGQCFKQKLEKLVNQSIRYCKYCDKNKEILKFATSELINHYPKCKECTTIYSKNYYENNKEKQVQKSKQYQKENRYKVLERQKEYRLNNKQKLSEYNKQYHLNKKEELNKKRNIRQIKRRKVDFLFRLRQDVSSAINIALKKQLSSKNNQSILNYLPFKILELKEHFEKLFAHPDNLDLNGKIWMNWDNQGKYIPNDYNYLNRCLTNFEKAKWQLDHIIPQSDLPYTSMEDENFKKCWSLENLRPLRADINIIDGVNKTRHQVIKNQGN